MTIDLPPIQVPKGSERQAKKLISSLRKITQLTSDPEVEGSAGPRLVSAAFDHAFESAEQQIEKSAAKH